MPIQTSYEFAFNDEEMSRILGEALKKDERLQPYSVIVGSPHAQYVEFGSPPIVDKETYEPRKGKRKGDDTELFKAIKEWVMARNNGTWKKETVYLIYRSILLNGTPPQPFIRPAYHDVERMIQRGEQMDEESDNLFESFALTLRNRMIHYLEENKTLYGEEKIKNSIQVVRFDESRRGVDRPDMHDKLWDDDYANYEGNPQPAMDRKQNLNKLRWE